jgi:cob(I)alamin adenosyltransferase
MVRLDRIYTRSGDQGLTSTGDGTRVAKLHPRIVAGGSVDETNVALGLAVASGLPDELSTTVRRLQQFLFDLGADLCVPLSEHEDTSKTVRRVTSEQVLALEMLIDSFTERLEPLHSFVLPGGSSSAAALHMARACCRRAELDVLRLHDTEPVNPQLRIALNRLSDLLFVLARMANDCGRADILWQPGSGL